MAPEDAVRGIRACSTESLGVSLGGSGGAPTALTGDTDMNGDMEGDYNSSSGEPDEDADGEEGMSSGDDSDDDSELLRPLTLHIGTGCHGRSLVGCLESPANDATR